MLSTLKTIEKKVTEGKELCPFCKKNIIKIEINVTLDSTRTDRKSYDSRFSKSCEADLCRVKSLNLASKRLKNGLKN